MPTFSKLIAAVAFAAVALFSAQAFMAAHPDGVQYGQFLPFSTLIGLLCGWRIMGRATGQGYGAALGSGVKTSAMIVVWALIVFSIVLMVRKAFRKRYDGPMEAVVDIFALALEQVQLMLNAPFLLTLLIGGLLGGLISEWARRRWE
ncbi:TrgA family protein [Szabonella alba]|uniref:TrgA family protein n=1 Tax=Szabonella alba TaxID=2804194 RepID=A0A8K0VC76_9RHOB|nr:TrgA family protein [Szabonella alba]MBL4917563.1 TrgA family protein [Szabonella alba]